MFTQFFGNFLLSKNIIDKDQLLETLNDQKSVRLKLGTLAIYEGLMTASEVEKIHILQTHVDKKFGQLAIEEGYLTKQQVDKLCQDQQPDYLLFGQTLIDKGYISTNQFEGLLTDYQSEYEIDNMDFDEETKDKIIALVRNFYTFEDNDNADKYINYLILFFNNLIRFIGKDFTPLSAEILPEYATNCCTTQKIIGETSLFTAIDMDVTTSIAFASRYMCKELEDYNEYVSASVEDFLNLHNGLFAVNMSNEFDIELDLEPLEQLPNTIISLDAHIYYIPIIFPFGTMNIIIS